MIRIWLLTLFLLFFLTGYSDASTVLDQPELNIGESFWMKSSTEGVTFSELSGTEGNEFYYLFLPELSFPNSYIGGTDIFYNSEVYYNDIIYSMFWQPYNFDYSQSTSYSGLTITKSKKFERKNAIKDFTIQSSRDVDAIILVPEPSTLAFILMAFTVFVFRNKGG